MSDLTEQQASQSVKVTGSSLTGAESNYWAVGIDGSGQTKDISDGTPGSAVPATAMQIAGSDGTNLRTIKTRTDGTIVTTALTGFGADFVFADVTLAATTQAVVRRTVYTEQTTNAQRSIASASANDTSAGTGARTVMIIYYDQTGAGPFTETLTLNGTTGVNTVSTTICFIENIEVLTVGSTGSNVGIITLYSAVAKGGVAIWTIAATDNQTFGAHHYVPTGKTCNITGMSCSHNGTTVGSGGLFVLKAKSLSNAAAAEVQVSDFVRLYGQSSTFGRVYSSPIQVVGPARVIAYVKPETASSTVYRAAFDFFEP